MFLEVATDNRHKKARQAFRRRACLNSGTFGLHSSANEVSHLKSDNGAVVRHIERSLAAGTKCGEPFAVEESLQKLVVDCQIKAIDCIFACSKTDRDPLWAGVRGSNDFPGKQHFHLRDGFQNEA